MQSARTHALSLALVLTWPACVAAQPQGAPPTAPAAQSAPSPATATPAMPSTQSPPASTSTQPTMPPQPDPVETEFGDSDRDGDGKVSASEHAASAKAKFDAMDSDHNYTVSTREMNDAGGQSVGDQIARAAQVRPTDENNNGEISAEESRVDAEAAFRARDTNRDGSLSLDEMKAAANPPRN